MSIGDRIIDAVIRSGAIEKAIIEGDATVFVWRANAAEQIEAAFSESEPPSITPPSNGHDL